MDGRRSVSNVVAQILVFAAVFSAFISILWQINSNLRAQGLTAGYGFLFRSTGWDVAFSPLPYTINDSYIRVLFIGYLNTILLGLTCLLTASFFGLVVGAARASNHPLLRWSGTFYVEATRNIPLVLQIIFIYLLLINAPATSHAANFGEVFFLSSRGVFVPIINIGILGNVFVALGLTLCLILAAMSAVKPGSDRRKYLLWLLAVAAMVLLFVVVNLAGRPAAEWLSIPKRQGLNFVGGQTIAPELMSMFLGITIYGGAFIGEVVRGGLNAVPRGTLEAAKVLGLTPWQSFFYVHLPQAVRIMIPMLSNQYVWLMKATTLGIAVGFTDFFMVVSTSINQTAHTIELIVVLIIGFLILNGVISFAMNVLNRVVNKGGASIR
ncbi:general L-amino acid transport system permease protein [Mesorhizobium shonense]|uniref:General L-amino acid transport system permease protein n=1 Tax=Mesorhizobium shonense TaxID=1209948 RepID=A0ABV2HX70_9HYPH